GGPHHAACPASTSGHVSNAQTLRRRLCPTRPPRQPLLWLSQRFLPPRYRRTPSPSPPALPRREAERPRRREASRPTTIRSRRLFPTAWPLFPLFLPFPPRPTYLASSVTNAL